VVRARRFDVAGEKYVLCSDKAHGTVEFSTPEEITLTEFAELRNVHRVSDDERKERWPDAKSLWYYRVKSYEPFDGLREYAAQDNSVPKAFPGDAASFVAAVTPDVLSQMQVGGIGEVATRLTDLWRTHFASTDKITSDGLNREDVLNVGRGAGDGKD